ncbi:SusC/RagA family TonB-linked outer membrane protein [Pontibacter harenae]|uniref:SusC/RagA family TonB-linked outer membrane protein n=1 Tax=Pontibacter harenae TaxID=2894083 RepID=UPI001E4D3418|nr:TonB-dependent receptor [Pontibacter harenae]MCC9167007.1 TonB-dependent receptor [Pontibacter harenae]
MAYAQQSVRGKVTSETDGLGLPGVSVRVKSDPSIGTISDVDGNFQLNVPSGDVTLLFSFTGFETQEVPLNNRAEVNVALGEDVKALEEVVVVGYGVQKKKLVTGATTQVAGEDLQKQSTTNALQALQGQAPGVQISSTSGQPGEGMRVVVRGLGTIGDSGPLYVVDGVLTGDISYLNPADIQSIDILKDAASAAIYGSQAANGVVLITTRQGKAGQPAQITFDTYYGVQNVARTHDMLNSREYATIMNEAMVNSGRLPRFTNDEIAAMGEGTNWLDEMFVDNAITQNYSLGAQGSKEGSVFSTSLSYTSQEGIVGGKDLSFYERYNFRINSEHNIYKDIVKMGEHLTFAYIQNNGIGVGNQYNNSLRGAFNTSPFVPMYDADGNFWDNSNAAWAGGAEANPYAQMVYSNQNRRNNQRLLGDVYLTIEPIKNLRFRTSLGMDYSAGESRSFTPTYRLSIYAFNDFTRASQSLNKGRSILWDNLLTYNFYAGQDHNFEVMLGSSAFQNDGSSIYGSNTHLTFNDLEHAWLNNATNADGVNIDLSGAPYDMDRRMSYFGRLNYNYKEKYLLNTTFRADGSSRFAPGNQWGYFPSVSAGWVVSEEAFMQNSVEWLNYFKLRASWGQVGNQSIPPFRYMAQVDFRNTNYTFGPGEGALVPGDALLTPGAYPSRLSNLNLQWETSQQTDIGFDAYLLNNKLTLTFDWYDKLTKDWLIQAPVLATAGAQPPYINGGNVRNSGVELAISYNDNIGDFNYSVGLNGAYNKNKVGEIPTADGIVHGDVNQLFDNSLEFYRAQNGFPIGYFWGLETAGIFQTEEEVNSYRTGEGRIIQPSAQPGDVRYVDQNSDGVINDQDRTMIGNPNPEYTFGATLSANYKGFDLSVLASGVAGNDIVQSYRNQANQFANFSSSILDRWYGPGSSNTIPRVTEDNRNWTNFSDLYIHDGDFLRISNVTLGYDFGKLINKGFVKQVRLYASVQNLYTFTRYNGMDPEIGYSIGFAQGVDLGYYPRPRTTMIGANIRF